MRKISIIKTSILLILLIALSCETEKILFTGPYHVRFTDESITKKESFSDAIKIEIHKAGPAPAEDLTINYTITGSARAGIDYAIVGEQNTVTIKKGAYFGYIEVLLINNANNILRSQDIIFTLQSTSDSKIEVGQGPSAIGKVFTLTIQDDCILSGLYNGTVNALDVPIEGISITSSDCENYLLSNWNINFFSPPYDYSLTFIDNGDNTLTVQEQGSEETIEGKGVIDPITRKISFELLYKYEEDEVEKEDTYTFTLTPQ